MLERRRRKKQSQKQRNEELKWRIFRSDAHLFLWLHFPKLALMPERNQISRCSSYTISKLSPSSSTCLLTLASLSLANNSNRHSRISFSFPSPFLSLLHFCFRRCLKATSWRTKKQTKQSSWE